jgi:hypothetical protein
MPYLLSVPFSWSVFRATKSSVVNQFQGCSCFFERSVVGFFILLAAARDRENADVVEQFRVRQAVLNRAPSSHGQARHGPVFGIANRAVIFVDVGDHSFQKVVSEICVLHHVFAKFHAHSPFENPVMPSESRN